MQIVDWLGDLVVVVVDDSDDDDDEEDNVVVVAVVDYEYRVVVDETAVALLNQAVAVAVAVAVVAVVAGSGDGDAVDGVEAMGPDDENSVGY